MNEKITPKSLPLVTIVIPVYNGSDYLNESIESALSQTYQNIEVIVVNDGSTDYGKTRNVALSYGSRIRYFEKENGGVSSALNLGIKKMQGSYFSWLSHDDLYSSDKIQKQVSIALASECRNDIIVYSDSINFFNNSVGIFSGAKRYKNKSIRYCLTRANKINGCTLLIPATVFEKCGLFDESLRFVQDNEMWFRIAKYFEFFHIEEGLVYSRMHANQTGNVNKQKAIIEADNLKLFFIGELAAADFGTTNVTWTSYMPIYWEMKRSGYTLAPKTLKEKILNHQKGGGGFLQLATLWTIDGLINFTAYIIYLRNRIIKNKILS
jgi:glycosyltransferase involved in cell wall biosynthesis